MEINLSDILAKLRGMERRLQLMLAAGVIAVAYLGFMGFQYWGEYTTYGALVEAQETHLHDISVAGRVSAPPPSRIASAQAAYDETIARFSHAHPDDVIVFLDDVASRSRVSLATISPGDTGSEERDGIRYQTRRFTLRVDGSLNNIYGFLEELSSVALVSLSSVNLSGLDGNPSANLSLTLFVDPELAASGGASDDS
ncbi:MAG: hypothetical protein WD533_03495 [Dehalococcoidia bacterium]